VGDVWLELDAIVIEAQAASAVGPPGEALRLAEELLGMARAVKSLRLEALAHLVAARPALRLGQPAVGERHLRAARRILGARPASAESGDADVVEAMLRLERGQWKRAEQPAERLEAWGRRGGWKLYQPVGPLVLGRARLGMGKPEEALAPLTAAVAAARDADAAGALALGRACLDQARILSGRARRAGSPRPSSPEVEAIALENRALLASLSGDAAGATEGFAHAVARWEDLGLTSWLARTLAFQAEALRAAKRPAGARKAEARSASVMAALAPTRARTARA
jgi:hypothetical protein